MGNDDKIPIGKYIVAVLTQPDKAFIKVTLKDPINIKLGDIITLDMIEPYESDAVRKVAEYLSHKINPDCSYNLTQYCLENAKRIVELVHEAEDSDE